MSTDTAVAPPFNLSKKMLHLAVLGVIAFVAWRLVTGVIDARESYQKQVVDEVAKGWGQPVDFRGVALVIPYYDAKNKARAYLEFSPSRTSSSTDLIPETRQRGFFHATVYTARVAIGGDFLLPSEKMIMDFIGKDSVVFWGDAFFWLDVNSHAGMTAKDGLVVNDISLPWNSCIEVNNILDRCRGEEMIARPHWTVPLQPNASLDFKGSLTFRGTSAFAPPGMGGKSEAIVRSPWQSPSFSGVSLPESYSAGDQGFEARWERNFATLSPMYTMASVSGTKYMKDSPRVELLEATPIYRMIDRASKYNLLFVAMAFTTYLLFELLSGLRIHYMQYGLAALSLSLFPLLLTSFGEPLGYQAGYAISALLVLVQASLYTVSVARSFMKTLVFSGMLSALFAYLYVMLSLESYALLAGTSGLFVLVSLVMYLTRNIDWSKASPVLSKGA